MKKNPLDPQDAPTGTRPTRKKGRKSNEREMLSRNVEITGLSTTVRLNAVHHKGAEPYVESQPELRGTATEPVNGVTDVKISMWLRETPKVRTARPASVGAVLGAKPELSFGLAWLPDAFDRVWTLALSGHPKFAHVYSTKPQCNSGLVVAHRFRMNRKSDERSCRLETHSPIRLDPRDDSKAESRREPHRSPSVNENMSDRGGSS